MLNDAIQLILGDDKLRESIDDFLEAATHALGNPTGGFEYIYDESGGDFPYHPAKKLKMSVCYNYSENIAKVVFKTVVIAQPEKNTIPSIFFMGETALPLYSHQEVSIQYSSSDAIRWSQDLMAEHLNMCQDLLGKTLDSEPIDE